MWAGGEISPPVYLVERIEMASVEELEDEIWLRENVRVVVRASAGDFGYYGFQQMRDDRTIEHLKKDRLDPFFKGMPYAIISGDGLNVTNADSRSLGSLRYTYRQELSR